MTGLPFKLPSMHLFVCTEQNYPLIWRKQRANPASLQWHIKVSCAAMVWPWLGFKHYGLNFFCFPLSCFFFLLFFCLFHIFFTLFSLFACRSLNVSQKSHSNKNDNNESNVFSETLSQWPRKLDVKEMLNSDNFYVQLPAIYPVQYCSVAGLMDTSCWELRD